MQPPTALGRHRSTGDSPPRATEHRLYALPVPPAPARWDAVLPGPGDPAPDFTLPRLDPEGLPLSLASYRGRAVLLVFSDPDCAPCDLLLPDLERIHRTDPTVQVLLVSRGTLTANRAKVATNGITFPVVLQRHWEISRAYGTTALPTGYLIDAHGVLLSAAAIGRDAILDLLGRVPAGDTQHVTREEAVPMDHPFDILAKVAAGEMPRRRVLKIAVAGAAAAALQPLAGVRRAFAGNPARNPPPCPSGYTLFSFYSFAVPPPVNGTPSEICLSGSVVPGTLIRVSGQRIAINGSPIVNGFVTIPGVKVNGNYARLVVNGRPSYFNGIDSSGTPVTLATQTGPVRITGLGNRRGAYLNGNQLVYDTDFVPTFLPFISTNPACPDGYTLGVNGCMPSVNGGPGVNGGVPSVNGTATPELGSGTLLATGLAAAGVTLYRRRSHSRSAAPATASNSTISEGGIAPRPSDSDR